jgi:uncharacterized repeat protein (TIGR03803 family)
LSGGTTTLHNFKDYDGYDPGGLILGSDGNLYGTTYQGGTGSVGTIFKISPVSPHKLTELYSFSTGGIYPGAGLLLAQDGNYYGTTIASSIEGDGGSIFQMTPGGNVTFLYQFPGSAGGGPDAALIQAQDGTFYGTTYGGGQYGGGIVFKMTTAFTVAILHSFGQGTDGAVPGGLVLGPNGNLYGTTFNGGTTAHGTANGDGTVYELSTDGASYTVLHNFGDGSVPNDGLYPNGPLVVGADNNLYGTTYFGGSAKEGTVFRISP